MKNTLIVAHRGVSSLYPENTLVSFRQAMMLGVDFMELDVRLTKDNELVVLHDHTLHRTTNGKGEVNQLTLKEIKRYSAGRWFFEDFAGEKIPTLREVFELMSRKTRLRIEIKAPGLEKRLLSLIGDYEMTDCVICSSFNIDDSINIKRLNPAIKTAYITNFFDLKMTETLLKKKVDMVDIEYRNISPAILEHCHRNGFPVTAWTIDDLEEMADFVRMGIDAICTNFPHLLKKLLVK